MIDWKSTDKSVIQIKPITKEDEQLLKDMEIGCGGFLAV